ncbi:CotY/CotZ family spore coat protein [Sporosarcina sp. G11-34]|uniref:CotY/CotZ family spore coat protein n=1 Tax=Sporosarcina sp. G11-34 TaxID=2849605 RepID=UPI0022A997DD|nr:CotY/CotZ family spore coat protein [Sporosarcina sp. G11-34]MCZ2257209.1 spore coat protein CotZ [Sporosarcina sp. G11-34]
MGCGKGDNVGHDRHSTHCVCDVLRAIKDIQDNGADEECRECTTSCFMEPLGGISNPGKRKPIDTRVFMLLTKNGDPFKAFYRDGDCPDTNCYSVFFRVEEVFGNCCATLRVLEPLKKDKTEANLLDSTGTTLKLNNICAVCKFKATDSCITVDLSCFCGVQCVDDVFLNIC